MKIYDCIGNLRLLNVKVILNDKEIIYQGMIEEASEDIKKMKYSKIEIDNGITNLYVYKL